jgi:flagellar biosynthesis protein FlhG
MNQTLMNASPGKLIAIASGKGGVGKTWFAITLAHALARQGRKILLFDADLGLANIDIQLGLTPTRDVSTLLAGRASAAETILPFKSGGFDILPGRSGSGTLASLEEARLDRLIELLQTQAASYDHVLLDLGAGLDRTQRRLAAAATTLLVLVTEEPTALTDAYAVIKLHQQDSANHDVRVVVNQAGTRSGGERTYATLARACGHFLNQAPILAGVIRRDDKVREAIRRQTLLLTRHPGSHAAADVEIVAAALFAAWRLP